MVIEWERRHWRDGDAAFFQRCFLPRVCVCVWSIGFVGAKSGHEPGLGQNDFVCVGVRAVRGCKKRLSQHTQTRRVYILL